MLHPALGAQYTRLTQTQRYAILPTHMIRNMESNWMAFTCVHNYNTEIHTHIVVLGAQVHWMKYSHCCPYWHTCWHVYTSTCIFSFSPHPKWVCVVSEIGVSVILVIRSSIRANETGRPWHRLTGQHRYRHKLTQGEMDWFNYTARVRTQPPTPTPPHPTHTHPTQKQHTHT